MNRTSMSIFILFLCLCSMTRVQGHYDHYEISAVFGVTPVIDGNMSLHEWEDASVVSFNNTVVLVKQNGESLFVGFNVSDATDVPWADLVGFALDLNHDGNASDVSDVWIFGVKRDGGAFELHITGPPSPPSGGWTVAVQSETDGYMAEFNVTYGRMNVTGGEDMTLGMAIESDDYDPERMPIRYFWPPLEAAEVNPSNYGDLVSTDNWVPEFPSLLILTLFMITALLAALVCEREKKRS